MVKKNQEPVAQPVLDRSNSGANHRLYSFVERMERLAEERAGIGEDMKEVMGEAKGEGFDTKTIRTVLRRRKMDKTTRQEADALLELYEETVDRVEKADFDKSVENGA